MSQNSKTVFQNNAEIVINCFSNAVGANVWVRPYYVVLRPALLQSCNNESINMCNAKKTN